MSSDVHFPRLARFVLLGAAGLASASFSFWTPSPWAAPCAASTQDPYGGGQDEVIQLPGDDGMPLPANRRRQKTARKKGNAADKSTKKADPAAKGKTASKKGGADASGKLKFSLDIAPILVANCTGCHSGDGNGVKRGKLDLSTFAKLQTGTPDHKVVEAGKPEESTLIGRIKGEIEPRMPQGGNNNKLSAAAIAKIERWVKEGATIDSGSDPKKPMASYAASADQVRRAELAKLPAGEVDKKTEEVGLSRFKQANASLKPEIVRSEHFMIFSDMPKERATNTLRALETQFGHLNRILGNAAGSWPEKISIYAFSSRKDYVEFVRTVEARPDVEAEEATTARLSVPQPYVAAADPQGVKGRAGHGRRTQAQGARPPWVRKSVGRPGRPHFGRAANGVARLGGGDLRRQSAEMARVRNRQLSGRASRAAQLLLSPASANNPRQLPARLANQGE